MRVGAVEAVVPLAEVAPRRALERLGVKNRVNLFQNADLSALSAYPEIAKLRKFLRKHGVTDGSTSRAEHRGGSTPRRKRSA
jgi:hypothetical protein